MTRQRDGDHLLYLGAWARCASALAAIALGLDARGAPDTFGLGDGHTGSVTLASSGPVNRYVVLTAPAAAGDSSLTVANTTGYSAGDLVMILQTTGLVPSPPSGDGTGGAVTIATDPVGTFELARVASIAGVANGTLNFSDPLVNNFATNATQVIRVPEYTDLTINPGVTLSALPWNGSTGGVVVFLATGTVTNNGIISAANQGFRGGVFVNGPTADLCTGLDEPPPGGGQKGEGIQVDRYGLSGTAFTGYGVVSNGAGGGICHNSGGGGGGNGGVGGNGGYPWSGETPRPPGGEGRDVGGRGGRALVYSQFDHMTLGGGGGAGHGNDNVATSGAAGGGAIYIRAATLSGSGTVRADGQTAGNTPVPGNDAAGGGGAGGSISLRVVNALNCGAVSAAGGGGGSVTYFCLGCQTEHGPGGGGGGGRILLQSTNIEANPGDCTANVASGLAGTTHRSVTGALINYGATPTSSSGIYLGIATIASGGGFVASIPPPVIAAPADGSSTSNNQPPVSGSESLAGSQVVVYIDGRVACTSSVSGGVWSCAAPTALAVGTHSATAVATYQGTQSLPSNTVTFTVTAGPPPPPPVITTPSNGSRTADNRPTVTGMAEPGSKVNASIDGVPICSVVADAYGNWSCDVGASLPLGPHMATATATNPNGSSDPTSSGFTIFEHVLNYKGGGFGCSAAGGTDELWIVAALAAFLMRRRLR